MEKMTLNPFELEIGCRLGLYDSYGSVDVGVMDWISKGTVSLDNQVY